jgi:uncharacterized OsmC-like protein
MLIEYAGGMKLIARHRGLEMITDQVKEQGGENSALTPTEAFVAALGTCVGVYVLNFAKRHHIPVEGMKIEVDYTYGEKPRRIASVQIRVKMPQPVSEQYRVALQRAAEQCLVHNSLRQPPAVTITLS